ncbi:MAG: NAD(P)H-dependent oxidoreductase subunit E [Bacteroidota bacterium]|nr:NAD(P)H-dependent oxidoreductase subunit E [Bacteroidota bacterium]
MAEVQELVTKLADKLGRERASLMPILQEIVEENKYLSKEAMIEVAKQLDLSAADVYGTASFYSFLDTEERGEYVIRVCKSIIAEMKGKKEIIKTLENLFKIKVGETSSCKKFTLLETNDIGWSDHEPSMLINDVPYIDLTPDKVIKIICKYRNKK